MAYSRRDRIGHFVRKQQQTRRPCTHACCRGYREHPANYPVILPDRTLRRARDEELQQHFTRLSDDPSGKARIGEARILYEMERRDRAEQQRADRAGQRARARRSQQAARSAGRMEREAEAQRIRLQAEAATRGDLVTPQGRARGIADEEILTGREAVFWRYATDEAKDFFTRNPRPTAAYFRGRDTRAVERATEPRRRRRPVTSSRTRP